MAAPSCADCSRFTFWPTAIVTPWGCGVYTYCKGERANGAKGAYFVFDPHKRGAWDAWCERQPWARREEVSVGLD